MGREIRRVPPGWMHPKEEKWDPFKGRAELRYVPMYNRDAESAWREWLAEYKAWAEGGFEEVLARHPDAGYTKNEPYRAHCDWNGSPPDPARYRPAWSEAEATWFQMYETVSEGTPVSPAFETPEELVEYLVANGDFWDQRNRAEGVKDFPCEPWPRDRAEAFVKCGWAPGAAFINGRQVHGADVCISAGKASE